MPIKLVCFKAGERDITENSISEYEKEGYTFNTVIPIYTNPMSADACIILEKHKDK